MKRQQGGAAFVHQAGIYGSDAQFLALAVPFIEDGLGLGEPVLVTTTSANLALLDDALGARARQVDSAESAYFGRRPPQRVAAFHRYWTRHAPAANGGHVRILAEPVWAGRSPAEVLAWKRMESGLNVLLSATNIWMICPYDTRAAHPAIIADARRTHPTSVEGRDTQHCAEFVDPTAFARACDADPLPAPPPDAVRHDFAGDLHALRRFVAERSAASGLTGEAATLLLVAVSEVANQVLEQGSGRAAVRMWKGFSALVVDLDDPDGPDGPAVDPFLGFRQPGLEPDPGDGLWLARQLCDWVDVRAGASGGRTVRLRYPSRHAAEGLQR